MHPLRTSVINGYSLRAADRLQCIFVHIPKCAGVAVAKSLFECLGPGHLRAADYRRIYTAEEFERFFKFAFVRNPWDRLASAYFYLKAGGMNHWDRVFAAEHLSQHSDFPTFVMNWVPQHARNFLHFRPQTYYIEDGHFLNFLGRFESIQADFQTVCDQLQMKARLAVLNKSERPDYRSLYNDRMREIVAEVYAQDIAAFGYDFDNSNLSHFLAARRVSLES